MVFGGTKRWSGGYSLFWSGYKILLLASGMTTVSLSSWTNSPYLLLDIWYPLQPRSKAQDLTFQKPMFPGIVTRVERLKVPDLARRGQQWSANITFNFLLSTLNRLKEILTASADLTYHLLDFDPSKGHVSFQVLPSNSAFNFLPDWFLVHFGAEWVYWFLVS